MSVLLLCVTILTGCADPVVQGLPSAPQYVSPVAPVAEKLNPYQIQVGDVLEIKLLLNPELEEQVTVRPDGMVSTAVAQNVPAFGRTPEELQADLNERYKKHLSEPNLAVIVKNFAPTRIYVLGEVNSPGEYISVGPNLTLLQALARAGGLKNSALTEQIMILRRGSADNPEIYAASYDNATSGLQPGADVRLAAYDVVYVPKTTIADAYVNYEQYIQQFMRPAMGLSLGYQLNPS
ncbi:polysaccharide biosynthesis/export family protein [Nitrosomonas sp.]|uniref:polysaccharide biosynthesis/export family protein n=1 Tax=Nitrosomonas sp. TaxID=42353 RepID=UPI001E0F081E|nr:polysaccharide biosynthesis/export family protein [Nitrosomonas sp.]MCB1950011.1 polysaccharide biosynthesis/export family protein [Nitrosomonas sp.]